MTNSYNAICQDTFSIVGLDSTSRQIGSAGASCLDLYFAGINNPAFLTDILPDTGVVNTQSYFIQANQDNARTRLRLGQTPSQTISWLITNDANNNPQFKQYGIVAFNGNNPSSASHTGTACINYKNHVNGSINGFYYAIQGNILLGQSVLDSMESRFRNTNGPLACKLMAAMQGAKVIGADTRCNNSSSLFAFLQVANPTDTHGNPFLNISLKTKQVDNVEPIDSLQKLFNVNQNCLTLGSEENKGLIKFNIYPNPTNNFLTITGHSPISKIQLYNAQGQKLFEEQYVQPKTNISISLDGLSNSIYFVYLFNNEINYKYKLIKQ
ncbi:MAG: DUF1028 domain-containing protein [Bacteroidia bacterium]|nr:DUF1028 domain-containing protein [Bacteroidia bacterium]